MDTHGKPRLGTFLRQLMEEVAKNSMGKQCQADTDIPLTKQGAAALFVNDGESVELFVRINHKLEVDPDGEANLTLKLWNSYR